jgi:hypothetical protein
VSVRFSEFTPGFLNTTTILLCFVVLSACSNSSGESPRNAETLMAVAQVFNDDYGHNNDGSVYDRWDARSRALITRPDYIRRHLECATAPKEPAHVENAAKDLGDAWLVRYEINNLRFTDYWFYVHGQWVFDLILSNPAAARLYRLPYAAYVHLLGCTGN